MYTLEHVPADVSEKKGSTLPEDIHKCLHADVLPDCFRDSVVSVEVQSRSVINCFTRNSDNTVARRNCLNRCTAGKNHETVKFGPTTQFVHTWMYGDSTHPPRPALEGMRPYNAFFLKRPIESNVVLRIKDNPQLQK